MDSKDNINKESQILRYFELDIQIAKLTERRQVATEIIKLLKETEDVYTVITYIREKYLC